jgi:hypothetical protein
LKKKNNPDILGGLFGKASQIGLSDELSTMDMDAIEETILGIFKTTELGIKRSKNASSNVDFDEEGIEFSEEKKKVFNTVKEPKNKKKIKIDTKSSGDKVDHNLSLLSGQLNNADLLTLFNQGSSDPIVNSLFMSLMGGHTLTSLFNPNDNIQNLLGSDYSCPFNNNLFGQIIPSNIENELNLDNITNRNTFPVLNDILSDTQQEQKRPDLIINDMNNFLLNYLTLQMVGNSEILPLLQSLMQINPIEMNKELSLPYLTNMSHLNDVTLNPEAKIDHFFTNFNKNLLDCLDRYEDKNKELNKN